ncbi:MAG TPA: hypothetical protein VIR27_21130 [Mycobacteriales bacterium]
MTPQSDEVTELDEQAVDDLIDQLETEFTEKMLFGDTCETASSSCTYTSSCVAC